MSQLQAHVDAEYLQFAARELNHIKQRSYEYMLIQHGHRVLDVGCGTGVDTVPLAGLVGETGQVIGIDINPDMVAKADQAAEKAEVSMRVVHKQADAKSLPFESAYFDSCRSERLFQYLTNPEQVLMEMIRVTKANGWVVVVDADWGTMSIDTPYTDIERKLSRFRADRFVCNGYSGRQLYRQLRQQGLVDVSTEVYATYMTSYPFARQATCLDVTEEEALQAGVITNDELHQWRFNLKNADAEGVFFAHVNLVLAAGRKTT
jgi:ubiquinone/menaquinone biosynthesis C-methylase UbiE